MSKTIGIDLGTTNSVVAFKDATVRVIATGPNNEDLCRSCVALDKSGSFAVGNAPYKNWKRYAPNIVVSVKRLMGAAISDPQVQQMKADKDMYHPLAELNKRIFKSANRFVVNVVYILKNCKCTYFP